MILNPELSYEFILWGSQNINLFTPKPLKVFLEHLVHPYYFEKKFKGHIFMLRIIRNMTYHTKA